MTDIHQTAVIAQGAKIGKNVTIGAYCVIGEHVVLSDNVILKPHCVIDGHTSVGEYTVIHSFASIGSVPQDLKYTGEAGRLVIGTHNTIREHVTINIGTLGGGMLTQIGNHNLLMVGVHIGHDSIVGNHTILVNNATLAGHVHVDDYAVLGGLSAVHQFCRIGRMAMIGGMTGVEHDVIPYGTVMGNRAVLKGLNLIGLERSGLEKEKIHAVRAAYKMLFTKNDMSFDERIMQTEKHYADNAQVIDIIAFLKSETKRRFVMPEER